MKKNGYTLIELLIALAVFTVVVAAPTGFFVSAIKGQQKALASQELYDNVSYVLEYMSRALRMARKDLDGSCSLIGATNMNYELTREGKGIIFLNYAGKCQEFYWDGNHLMEIRDKTESFQLTSSNIKVSKFMINGSGWSQTDNIQPKVTLFLEVEGTKGKLSELRPTMKIQTSISQRKLDIEY